MQQPQPLFTAQSLGGDSKAIYKPLEQDRRDIIMFIPADCGRICRAKMN